MKEVFLGEPQNNSTITIPHYLDKNINSFGRFEL